jgi:hypothetical protein
VWRCAGTEEGAVENLRMSEQADEGTWESQGDVECEKAEQNDIDTKYEEGDIGWLRSLLRSVLRRGRHDKRTNAEPEKRSCE